MEEWRPTSGPVSRPGWHAASDSDEAWLLVSPAGDGLVEPGPAMADLAREVGMSVGHASEAQAWPLSSVRAG